jgi:hypothetical protein
MQRWCPPSASWFRPEAMPPTLQCLSGCQDLSLRQLRAARTAGVHERQCAFVARDHCAEFIDTERWSRLAERAFQKFMKRHSVPRNSAIGVRVQFADLVREFAAHKTVAN